MNQSRIRVTLTLGLSSLALMLAGCFGMSMVPGHDFHKAAFTISGSQLMVRSDDSQPWLTTRVTMETDHGYYHQRVGDVHPGEVRALRIDQFTDQSGKQLQLNGQMQLKSVWVHGHYPDGLAVDELAFPAETFGLAPVQPQAGAQ